MEERLARRGRVPRWVMGWIDAGLAYRPHVGVGAEHGRMRLALVLSYKSYQQGVRLVRLLEQAKA